MPKVSLVLSGFSLLCGVTVAYGGEIAAEASSLMPRSAQLPLTAIEKVGGNFVAVGARGVSLRSPDGVQWEQVPTPVNRMLNSTHFVNSKLGWAVGHDESILQSKDGGQSWALQHFQSGDVPLLDVLFVDEKRGVAVGAFGKLLLTEDGGEHWLAGGSGDFNPMGAHLNSLAQLGDGRLFLVGEMGLIGVSKDGKNWESLSSPYSGSLFDAEPIGNKGAIVVGMRGNAYWTADIDSPDWNKIDTGGVDSLFSVSQGPQRGQFLIAGANNTVFKVAINLASQEHDLLTLRSETDKVLVYSGVVANGDALVLVGDQGPDLLK